MNKRKISLVAAIGILLAGMLLPFTTVLANETSDKGITIVEKTKNSLEYIHEKEEGTFKVVEQIDPDTGEVDSKIYKLNENDEYVLDREQTVTINENKDVIVESIYANGEKNEVLFENQQQNNKNKFNSDDEEFSTFSELTPWIYSGTNGYYTRSLIGLTISAIQTVLNNTVGLPTWADILADAAVEIAEVAHDSVYMHKMTSVKNVVGTTILAGIQERVTVYETSAQINMIGSVGVHEECAPGYDCSE